MIILSQEKNKIINFERITEITAVGKEIIVGDNIFEARGQIIAKYKTEERAKEVLQEIEKAIIDTRQLQEINMFFGGTEIIPSNTYYEMPEK